MFGNKAHESRSRCSGRREWVSEIILDPRTSELARKSLKVVSEKIHIRTRCSSIKMQRKLENASETLQRLQRLRVYCFMPKERFLQPHQESHSLRKISDESKKACNCVRTIDFVDSVRQDLPKHQNGFKLHALEPRCTSMLSD